MRCPICEKDCYEFLSIYDDRFGFPGYFLVASCQNCRHKSIQGNFKADLLKDLYTNYYPRSSFKLEDFNPYKEVKGFKAWFDGAFSSPYRWVPKGVRVLDIGCGFGESLGYYESRGCEAYGVEVDENIQRVADKFGYKVHVGVFNPDIYQSDFFDYVTMAQVIEHVPDPVSTLKGVAMILKSGGHLIMSLPNANGWGARVFGRRWINWHAPYHIHHFSVESMEIAACKAGLVMEKYRTITSSEWLSYQWLHLFTRPRMGSPSVFWSPLPIRGYKEKILLGLVQIFHFTKINHIATRFFDSLSMGDNYLFFLRKK